MIRKNKNSAILKVIGLTKYFNGKTAVDNINFNVRKGDIVVVIGPSGSGKTTLLRCIKGLEKIDKGKIFFRGDYKERIGFVSQYLDVWNNMTVIENVMLAPLIVQKRDKNETYKEALEILEKVDLYDKINDRSINLSGGQKQRTAIARALIMNPDVLCMDEITSALDPELIKGIQNTIKKLAEDGITMILVTHDMDFGMSVGTKFMFLEKGKMVAFGGKEIFRIKRIQDFIKGDIG